MHALIVGARGVGKSTLIRKVLQELDVSVSGYITRKEKALDDPVHGSPIYFYEVGKPQAQTPDNLLGYCLNHHPEVHVEAFDRVSPKVAAASYGDVILMDEVGFMESASERFSQAVFSHLEGEKPVIAAVKYNDFPYLEKIRSHPNCKCFYITEENRDELYHEVLRFMQIQLGK